MVDELRSRILYLTAPYNIGEHNIETFFSTKLFV